MHHSRDIGHQGNQSSATHCAEQNAIGKAECDWEIAEAHLIKKVKSKYQAANELEKNEHEAAA